MNPSLIRWSPRQLENPACCDLAHTIDQLIPTKVILTVRAARCRPNAIRTRSLSAQQASIQSRAPCWFQVNSWCCRIALQASMFVALQPSVLQRRSSLGSRYSTNTSISLFGGASIDVNMLLIADMTMVRTIAFNTPFVSHQHHSSNHSNSHVGQPAGKQSKVGDDPT